MMEREDSKEKSIAERVAALSPKQRAMFAARLKKNGLTQTEFAAIPRRSLSGPTPLSFAQQRLWFLDQLEPANPVYNVPLVVRLAGRLNATALEESLNEIVRRHEILRTSFPLVAGRPAQVIAPAAGLSLPVIDLSDVPPAQREEEARQSAAREAQRPFDLGRGPLVRTMLIRLADEEHVLVLTMHHIICDGWSMGILARELGALYDSFSSGDASPLPDLPVQYADFAVWQREWLSGEVLENQLAYWRRQLGDHATSLELPADRPRPPAQTYRGARVHVTLSESLTESLNELSRGEGVTLFMTLLAAFQALLHRYTGSDDITVGTPIANRTRSEVEGLIGFFVNTLVMRTDFSGDPTFRELLRRVREVSVGAYSHQDLPFEKLVEELQPERNASHPPLFNVMFALRNTPSAGINLRDLKASVIKVNGGTAKFDLSIQMSDEAGELKASATYNTDLFEAATIARMLGHFRVLLEAVVSDSEQRVSELPILAATERHQLLVEWNDTATYYPRRHCIHQLFESQAERSPDEPAVAFAERQLTYSHLNRRANQLAHYLRQRGVGAESKVGVAMERSPEMIVAILGVLKAGGAYVPLDPSYPKERIRLMTEDAGICVLLTQEHLTGSLPERDAETVCLDRDWDCIARQSSENPPGNVMAENTAYVIYTSGSTGTPKGILVPHRAVVRLVCDTNYVSLHPSDRIAQASNASFDAATFEIWGALLHGAQLVIVSREITLSPRDFVALIRERGINVLFLTTALFNQTAAALPSAFSSLRYLLIGGEAIDPKWVRKVMRGGPPRHFLHVYGPTESTTFASWYRIEDVPEAALTVPIGRPVSNTRIYLLNANLRPVPVGVPGELYVGGDGLARGYLNRSELTAERFIPDPFGAEPGARLYRTGDVARRLPDGNIEFIGRRDSQVKIRGHRIELGEIETVLREHPAVKEAAVLGHEVKENDRRLVAYTILNSSHANSDEETLRTSLRSHLRKKLPDYMMPSEFLRLDVLPLTANGKIDRAALSAFEPERRGGESSYEPPLGLLELQLAQIWEEVLGVSHVGVKDDFFELGGHSLLAVAMMERVERQCGRRLPLATLFAEATIEHLADACKQQMDERPSPSLVEIQPEGSQRPFFFLHGDHYNGGFYCLNLSRHLGQDQPFYAFPSHGFDGRRPPLTIEEMAEQHLDTLRRFQPEGPYLLGGFCHGALAAFEMARRLHEQGQRVDLLVLLHASAKNVRFELLQRGVKRLGAFFALTPEQELDWFVRLRHFRLLASKMSGLERTMFVLKKVRRLKPAVNLTDRRIGREFRRESPTSESVVGAQKRYSRRDTELHLRYANAAHGYVPRAYPGRVTLFWPEEAPAEGADDDPTMGWRNVAAEVAVYMIPGDHATCITHHHRAVAEQLRTCLNEIREHEDDNRE